MLRKLITVGFLALSIAFRPSLYSRQRNSLLHISKPGPQESRENQVTPNSPTYKEVTERYTPVISQAIPVAFLASIVFYVLTLLTGRLDKMDASSLAMSAKMDASSLATSAKMDASLSAMSAKIDASSSAMSARMDASSLAMSTQIDKLFNEVRDTLRDTNRRVDDLYQKPK